MPTNNIKHYDIKVFFPVLQKAVSDIFEEGDWKEIGYKTGTSDYISSHPRLLRSLHFNDPDYGGKVYSALEHIINHNIENFNILVEDEGIRKWIEENDNEAYHALYEEGSFVPPFKPTKIFTKEVVLKALKDADGFVASGEPENALDRIHTALHGYLQSICNKKSIVYQKNDNITTLFKLIRGKLFAFSVASPQTDDIKKISNSLASCIDAINKLRNNASMAHPNDRLLGDSEAKLAINATRTLFHYIEGKMS